MVKFIFEIKLQNESASNIKLYFKTRDSASIQRPRDHSLAGLTTFFLPAFSLERKSGRPQAGTAA